MTCVLPVPMVHSIRTDGAETQRQICRSLCFNNLSAKDAQLHSNSTTCRMCIETFHMEGNNRQSIDNPSELSKTLQDSTDCQQYCFQFEDCRNSNLDNTESELPMTVKDYEHSRGIDADANKRGQETFTLKNSKNGIKRKAEHTPSDEDTVPSKRISPFLNTQKERKDDRKKILKMSIKKLKDLDDPEAFLRRTVLVNNTMKRLQGDLQKEQVRSKYMKSLRRYGVRTNKCTSDGYLFDDPFLSGINEKITDDMTDTLINNVFEKESEIRTGIHVEVENSENDLNEKKLSDTNTIANSVSLNSSDVS